MINYEQAWWISPSENLFMNIIMKHNGCALKWKQVLRQMLMPSYEKFQNLTGFKIFWCNYMLNMNEVRNSTHENIWTTAEFISKLNNISCHIICKACFIKFKYEVSPLASELVTCTTHYYVPREPKTFFIRQ